MDILIYASVFVIMYASQLDCYGTQIPAWKETDMGKQKQKNGYNKIWFCTEGYGIKFTICFLVLVTLDCDLYTM